MRESLILLIWCFHGLLKTSLMRSSMQTRTENKLDEFLSKQVAPKEVVDDIKEGSDAVSVALGVAAATGLSLLAYTEVETLLQVLGSAAIVQFLSKKLLFAEDRKQTFIQLDEFLTKQVEDGAAAPNLPEIDLENPENAIHPTDDDVDVDGENESVSLLTSTSNSQEQSNEQSPTM